MKQLQNGKIDQITDHIHRFDLKKKNEREIRQREMKPVFSPCSFLADHRQNRSGLTAVRSR